MQKPEDTTTAGPLALSLHAGLGPLPEPALTHDRHGRDMLAIGGPCFTADQMRAYAAAAVATAIERCAKLCDEMQTRPPGDDPEDVERGYNAALSRAAKRIRGPNARLSG